MEHTSDILGSDKPTTNSKRVESNEDRNNEKMKRTDDPISQSACHFLCGGQERCICYQIDCLCCGRCDRRHHILSRLPYAQWDHNSIFELEPGKEIEVEDEEIGIIDLEFTFDSPDRNTHYCLHGRAYNIFQAGSNTLLHQTRTLPSRKKTDQLVTKLYWPEESRQSEAEILEAVD